jgi:tight adherence protein C
MIAQLLIAILVGLAFVCFAAAVIYSAMRLKAEVPAENREYLDPLPKLLRFLWPLLRLIDYHICACPNVTSLVQRKNYASQACCT